MKVRAQSKRHEANPPDVDWEKHFANSLETAARAVEIRLEELLGRSESDGRVPKKLSEAMRYATLGGGKRFRPFLVMATATLFGVEQARSVNVAAALECIHSYSLAHDDLPAMDADDFRRGRPTVHKAFDEATAILVGDALQALAFEILAGPATDEDAAIRSALVLGLARASGHAGMVGGQMYDLIAEEGSEQESNTVAGVTRIQDLKTGALIEFAAVSGAILGRADPEQIKVISRYARAVGLAFQVSDDLLDVEGTASEVGKATNKDQAAGKATFVSLLGIPAVRAKLKALETEALAALEGFGSEADVLRSAARFSTFRRR